MCACTDTFVCARCTGTPFDPRYYLDEPEPLSEEAFADLLHEPSFGPPLMSGGEA